MTQQINTDNRIENQRRIMKLIGSLQDEGTISPKHCHEINKLLSEIHGSDKYKSVNPFVMKFKLEGTLRKLNFQTLWALSEVCEDPNLYPFEDGKD
jgi:hypothetical protein